MNCAGREEASTESSFYSQDNKYLAFCGKNGNVHLASNQTKQKIADFKMNNISITVCFSPDGLTMFTGGGGITHTLPHCLPSPANACVVSCVVLCVRWLDASIYQWDLRTRRCIYKFIDEGMSKTSSLAISPSGAYHAVGYLTSSSPPPARLHTTAALPALAATHPRLGLQVADGRGERVLGGDDGRARNQAHAAEGAHEPADLRLRRQVQPRHTNHGHELVGQDLCLPFGTTTTQPSTSTSVARSSILTFVLFLRSSFLGALALDVGVRQLADRPHAAGQGDGL